MHKTIEFEGVFACCNTRNENRKFDPERKEREPKLENRSGTGMTFFVSLSSLPISVLCHDYLFGLRNYIRE